MRLLKYLKIMHLAVWIMLFIIISNDTIRAEELEGEPKVLVIYTTKDGELGPDQRYLDLLIGHFTSDIRFVSSDDVRKSDLLSVTHLFYFGQLSTYLPTTFLPALDGFDGTFVAIGYNTEKLGQRFNFIDTRHEINIDQISITGTNKTLDISESSIVEVEPDQGSEILMSGLMKSENINYPVMVRHERNYYYAFDYLDSRQSTLFAELLHDVFQVDHEHAYTGYIRLEDVHPLVDPEPLKEIASILKEKNIPYMVAVIPIYTNPITDRRYTFADSPKLLKVLRQIQRDGGSIVLHGYTHQFRASETGEGFEFWDVENNSPIYAPAEREITLKTEQDFPSQKAYDIYIDDLQAFEKSYTEAKINDGIDELTKYGLYPLAFEAPHYTMSQHGYQILADYFSTYVGQAQLSDQDWEIMDTAPYITSPSFFHNMQLLPETMGYVQPDLEEPIQRMIDQTERLGLVRDGMFAAFYHPYLGAEGFRELLSELEKLPNVSWINLKELDVWVKGENVSIYTRDGVIISEYGRYKVLLSSFDAIAYYIGEFVHYLAWVIAGLSSIAVITFIICACYLVNRNKLLEG